MPRWFRRKTFGYGWTPCTWQGWLVLAGFIAVTLAVNWGHFGIDRATRREITFALVVVAITVAAVTGGKDSDG